MTFITRRVGGVIKTGCDRGSAIGGPLSEGRQEAGVSKVAYEGAAYAISWPPDVRGSRTQEIMGLVGRRLFGMRATCPAY